MSRVVVSLPSTEVKEALDRGADLVELRADLIWGRVPDQDEIPWRFADKLILTYRSERHGGAGSLTEKGLEALEKFRESVAYVDVELEYIDLINGSGVIGSWHDLTGTPDLTALLSIARRLSKAEVIKVVTTARSLKDAYRVLELYGTEFRRRIVGFAMGELGTLSRRISAVLGAPLIYNYLDRPVAPGQISLEEGLMLKELMNKLKGGGKLIS